MKIESNKNWTTCLRLNTGDGSPRVFLLNSHFLGSVPIHLAFYFCFSFSIHNPRQQLRSTLPDLSQIGKWQWLCYRRILGAMLRLGNR